MPAKQPTPRELYPDWPTYKVSNLAHERVRQAVLGLKDFMRTSTELTSINKVARYCGVGESTLADFMAGRAWPSVLTLAQIEVSLGQPIWPVRVNAWTHGNANEKRTDWVRKRIYKGSLLALFPFGQNASSGREVFRLRSTEGFCGLPV